MRSRFNPGSDWDYFFVAEPFSAGFVGTLQDAAFVLEAAEGASMRGKFLVDGGVGGVIGLVVGLGLGFFTKHRSNLLIINTDGWKEGTKMRQGGGFFIGRGE